MKIGIREPQSKTKSIKSNWICGKSGKNISIKMKLIRKTYYLKFWIESFYHIKKLKMTFSPSSLEPFIIYEISMLFLSLLSPVLWGSGKLLNFKYLKCDRELFSYFFTERVLLLQVLNNSFSIWIQSTVIFTSLWASGTRKISWGCLTIWSGRWWTICGRITNFVRVK